MAAIMLSEEIKRINLDFNAKITNLRKEKEALERQEYDRLAAIKKDEEIARIAATKRQSDEANSAIKSITEREDAESSVISDSSGTEDEETIPKEIRPLNTKNAESDSDLSDDGSFSKVKKMSTPSMKRCDDGKKKPTNSDTAGPSFEKNEGTNFSPSENEQEPPIKMKKSLKRRIHETKDASSIYTLLHSIQQDFNVLREVNASIIRRLNTLETPTEQSVPNTNADTLQKGAFAALKVDWMPKVLNMLALIYAEVKQSTDE